MTVVCTNAGNVAYIYIRQAAGINSITPLYQDGQSWSNDLLGTKTSNSKYTIGAAGCLVTCIAMYYNYLTGGNMTPGTVNTNLKNADMNTANLDLRSVAAYYKWGVLLFDIGSFTLSDAVKVVSGSNGMGNDHPVIIKLERTNAPSHFVLAYGCQGSDVLINDPIKANNFTKLSQNLNIGYYITGFYSFAY